MYKCILTAIGLAALSIGSLLEAASYDAATSTVSNGVFSASLSLSSHLTDTEKEDIISVTGAAMDYWEQLIPESLHPQEDNKIVFTLGFTEMESDKIIATANSSRGYHSNPDDPRNYYGFTAENGISYNTMHNSQAKLLLGKTEFSSSSDFRITYNTKFDFHYGLDTNIGAGQTDFYSVLVHEMAHGMGFSNSLFGYDEDTNSVVLKHYYANAATGEVFLDNEGNPLLMIGLYDALIIENLPNQDPNEFTLGEAYAMGDPDMGLTLFNPLEYESGSSFSHITAESDPDAIMNKAIGKEVIKREFSERELEIFAQLGYVDTNPSLPEPSSVIIVLAMLPFGLMRRRRAA